MQKAVNYFRSHVRVEVEGAFPERFINLCSQNGIDFWDLRRPSPEMLHISMHIGDFRKIRKYARRAMCRVHILKKTGLKFFAWRFRKRYALTAGGLFCLGAVLVMSMHVWDIDIIGNDKVSTGRILASLEEHGVMIGTYAPSIDNDMIRNKVLLEIDELSWLAVNIKGSRATVEVRERTPAPELIPIYKPCNIIAKKAGLITRMSVLEGAGQVERGDTVIKGQILVSGIVDNAGVGARVVHAMARVTARTWYDEKAVVSLQAYRKNYTERSRSRHALVLGRMRINLYGKGGKVYDDCDKIIKGDTLTLFGAMVLPVTLVTETYYEYTAQPVSLSPADAEMRAADTLQAYVKKQIGEGEIVSRSLSAENTDSLLTVRLQCETLEDIAHTEEIPLQAIADLW